MEFTYAEGKLESKMLQPPGAVSNRVSDQDPDGSVFKSPPGSVSSKSNIAKKLTVCANFS